MNRIHRLYTTRSTWKVIDRLLDDSYLYTQTQYQIQERGLFNAASARLWTMELNETDYVYTQLDDVDWQQVADEINAN